MSDSILNPQLEKFQLSIQSHKALMERYEYRLLFIRSDFSSKTDYEKNEVEIKEFQTNTQMDLLGAKINEMEALFIDEFRELIEEHK